MTQAALIDVMHCCVQVVNGTDTGGAEALKAVRPVKAALLFAWYFAAFAAELAAFAVASATLHPIIVVPGYLPRCSGERSSGHGGLDRRIFWIR